MQHSHSLFAVLLVHNTYDIRLSNQGRKKFFSKRQLKTTFPRTQFLSVISNMSAYKKLELDLKGFEIKFLETPFKNADAVLHSSCVPSVA